MKTFLAACLLLIGLPAMAGEIVVLSSQGVTGVMESLIPEFEKLSGDKLVVKFGVSGAIKKEIDEGAFCDVAILARDQLDALAEQSKIVAGSPTNLARSGVGIAIKAGAAKPDLADKEAVKRLFLQSSGIAYTLGGASGVYFQKLIKEWGIEEQLKGRLHPQPAGRSAEQVAKGDSEIAIQQISELQGVPGTEVAGPLPPDLQIYTIFAAAISKDAKNPKGAKALIDFLSDPQHRSLIEAKGMQPG